MHDDDPDPVGSPTQRAWVDLTARLREGLTDEVAEMAKRDHEPKDLAALCDAVRTAFWLALNAHCFDKRVSLEHDRLFPAE